MPSTTSLSMRAILQLRCSLSRDTKPRTSRAGRDSLRRSKSSKQIKVSRIVKKDRVSRAGDTDLMKRVPLASFKVFRPREKESCAALSRNVAKVGRSEERRVGKGRG